MLKDEIRIFREEFIRRLHSGIFLIDQINRYILRGQGKTLRPMLAILCAKLAGKVSEKTYNAALIVEFLHIATLVHDDIVDESDFRRGLSSIRKIWKNKIAVLYGDYLLANSLKAMLDLRDLEVIDILSVCARRLARGELLQAAKTRKLDIDEQTYFEMISGKTAALISASAELGALTGGADAETRTALRLFGEDLGMAFQIRDDILDFEGRAGILGKPVGADLKGKKITLPLIYALQHSEDGRRGKILNAIKRHQNLKEVITFVRKSEGLHYSRTRAQDFVNSAQKRLDAFPPNPAKDLLCQLADYSINRNS